MELVERVFAFFLCFLFLGKPVFIGNAIAKSDPSRNLASFIQITSAPVQTRYFHDLNTARIGAMRHQKLQSRSLHVPGITLAEHELKTDYEIGGLRQGRHIRVWAESVRADFSFRKMEVYVSSQYPEGSCQYKVILTHENQHVAINLDTLKKYREIMARALMKTRSIPTKAHPLTVKSLDQGKKIIAARINRLIQPIYTRFKRAVLRENETIDTIANYRRTQALCSNW